MDIKACDICGKRITEPVINQFKCPAAGQSAELCFYGFTGNTAYICPSCANAIQNTINGQRRTALELGSNIDYINEEDE